MKQNSYLFKRQGFEKYVFSSIGKKTIVKVVEFSTTRTPNLYNLGFGDLLPNGAIDDKANSNNGDIVKVLATVIQIMGSFTLQYPEAKIVFVGSTKERTKLYARILKMYYADFGKEFKITALKEVNRQYIEVDFEPDQAGSYFAYFVKRIN